MRFPITAPSLSEGRREPCGFAPRGWRNSATGPAGLGKCAHPLPRSSPHKWGCEGLWPFLNLSHRGQAFSVMCPGSHATEGLRNTSLGTRRRFLLGRSPELCPPRCSCVDFGRGGANPASSGLLAVRKPRMVFTLLKGSNNIKFYEFPISVFINKVLLENS